MAIKQIYGPNQTAGIPVVGTGKSTPQNDGTTPLASLVALVDETGALISAANPLDVSGGGGGGGAVTIADGADVAEGAVADAAWVSGNGTVVSVLKGIFGKLAGTGRLSVNGADGSTIATTTNGLPVLPEGVQYETVAAGSTAQVLGGSGATGDYLAGLLVIPAVVGCGLVTVLDNATSIPVFVGGGTTALPSCIPFLIPLGIKSTSGAWKVTTGANVSVIGIGQFT